MNAEIVIQEKQATLYFGGMLTQNDYDQFWKGPEDAQGSEGIYTDTVHKIFDVCLQHAEKMDFQIWHPGQASFAANINPPEVPALVNELCKEFPGLEIEYSGPVVDALMKKWVVVMLPYADPNDAIRVTRRENFKEMNFCDCYGDYGVKVDCYNAGCYCLDNSESVIQSDMLLDIDRHFNTILFKYYGERYGMTFTSLDEFIGNVEEINNEDSDVHESWEYVPVDVAELKVFCEKYLAEKESHTQVTGWTFHDSHNFKTVVSETDFGDPDCSELDENEQAKILLQMPVTAPYMEGTNASEESENYTFHFDRWATNPWFCYVEKK